MEITELGRRITEFRIANPDLCITRFMINCIYIGFLFSELCTLKYDV